MKDTILEHAKKAPSKISKGQLLDLITSLTRRSLNDDTSKTFLSKCEADEKLRHQLRSAGIRAHIKSLAPVLASIGKTQEDLKITVQWSRKEGNLLATIRFSYREEFRGVRLKTEIDFSTAIGFTKKLTMLHRQLGEAEERYMQAAKRARKTTAQLRAIVAETLTLAILEDSELPEAKALTKSIDRFTKALKGKLAK